jgi:hypothetical protein
MDPDQFSSAAHTPGDGGQAAGILLHTLPAFDLPSGLRGRKPSQSRDSDAHPAEQASSASATLPVCRLPTASERERWTTYVLSVARDDSLTERQRIAFLETWQRILEREPSTMYPSCGVDGDGELFLSWNPRGLSLDIQVDRGGEVSWFFVNHRSHMSASSDENGGLGYLEHLRELRRI